MKDNRKLKERIVVTIDDKILKEGSYVRCRIGNIGVVKEFYLSEESVFLVKVALDEATEIDYPIHKLEIIDEDSVFETEDGFKLIVGDLAYWVFLDEGEASYKKALSTIIVKGHRKLLTRKDQRYFIFAHAHNAEEFINSKNKKFSIEDIKKAYYNTNPKLGKISHSFSELLKELKKL